MGPTERITPADRDRFEAMRAIGCVVSAVFFQKLGTPGQVHHIKAGDRRLGHQATICLTPWFHEGTPPLIRHAGRLQQLSVSEATRMFGPSMAINPEAFQARFGTQMELLEMQDALIEKYRESERKVASR